MDFFTKRYHPVGTPPGTLTSETGKSSESTRIQLLKYNEKNIDIYDQITADECTKHFPSDDIIWGHIEGTPSVDMLHKLSDLFQLHILALEDILNNGQRSKIEPFKDQLFIVINLPVTEGDLVNTYQMSFFLGPTFVISFCPEENAIFDPIIKRLQDDGSRLRSRGSDFLLYTLIDTVIDQGFPVLETISLQLETLEAKILSTANQSTLEDIHTLKRELILLRRVLWPQREVINQLLRNDSNLINQETILFLRDCYDHTIQIMELLESYRDISASMLDVYLSSISNRTNETMRVLTVIATIFIPLTFIVGVYGMNFDRSAGTLNMPELGSPYGYVTVWIVMVIIAAFMLLFFRRRGWF